MERNHLCNCERGHHEDIHAKLYETVVQEDMLFKEKAYGRRAHNGRRPITIPHVEPLAQVS